MESRDTPAIVSVSVEQQLPFGLLVRLEDGSQGLVREREIAWEHHERRRWREHYKPGDTIEALLLEPAQANQWAELSVRQARGDPWSELDPGALLGLLAEGTVTGVQPYGAFIEIRPGIVGLLHQARLPRWLQGEGLADIFWAGDRVKVMVERVDLGRRHIGLSLSRALVERWAEPATHQAIPRPRGSHPQPAPEAHDDLADLTPPPIWRILVVEDDPGQREALQRWLGDQGHTVLAAASGEEGLELLGRHKVDLLLSDYSLQGALSGIDVVRGALTARPGLHCALMTDWARASVHQAEIDAVRALGVPLLVKPLRPSDIDTLLFERALPAAEEDQGRGHLTGETTIEVGLARVKGHPAQALHPALERLRRTIRATTVLLFALEPAQRRVVIAAQVGAPPANLAALDSLIYSPVRDVAEDGHSLRIVDPARAEQRARYLRELLPFQSCVGAPVATQLTQRFALFAFSGREHAFGERQEEQLEAAAVAVAGMLEREQFLTRAADTQRLALLGQLSSALVHEMNHVLTALNFTLPNIEHLLAAITQPARALHQREHDEQLLQLGFADLRRGLDRLTSTARMFGRVTIHSGAGVTDLGATLAETVELVRDLADRQQVNLVARIPPTLPALAVPSAPLQQIVLNVLINAIQQIGLTRPGQAGRVVLSAAAPRGKADQHIQVRVEDDGPGIHRQLWERIFELGFTTRREGGSGLGLYICRSLGDALGVSIQVQASHIGWGSALVIDLPVAASSAPPEGATP